MCVEATSGDTVPYIDIHPTTDEAVNTGDTILPGADCVDSSWPRAYLLSYSPLPCFVLLTFRTSYSVRYILPRLQGSTLRSLTSTIAAGEEVPVRQGRQAGDDWFIITNPSKSFCAHPLEASIVTNLYLPTYSIVSPSQRSQVRRKINPRHWPRSANRRASRPSSTAYLQEERCGAVPAKKITTASAGSLATPRALRSANYLTKGIHHHSPYSQVSLVVHFGLSTST